jgi:hypothetical protein
MLLPGRVRRIGVTSDRIVKVQLRFLARFALVFYSTDTAFCALSCDDPLSRRSEQKGSIPPRLSRIDASGPTYIALCDWGSDPVSPDFGLFRGSPKRTSSVNPNFTHPGGQTLNTIDEQMVSG